MSLEYIERYVKDSEKTDKIIPMWLAFAAIIADAIALLVIAVGYFAEYGAGIGAGSEGVLFASIGLGIVILLAGAILSIYVLYKMIWRRNAHFRRTIMLYTSIANYLEAKGYHEEANKIKDETKRLELELGEEKSPALWTILSLIVPIIIYYVLHFLNADFVKHDRAERMILERLDRLFKNKLNESLELDYDSNIGKFPERNTVLYIVLTLITGVFGIYWWYVSVKDPNEHFKSHKLIEAKLLKLLEKLPEVA